MQVRVLSPVQKTRTMFTLNTLPKIDLSCGNGGCCILPSDAPASTSDLNAAAFTVALCAAFRNVGAYASEQQES